MPAWRAWSISCSSRKWARSPPSEAMTADSASSHSRVSCGVGVVGGSAEKRFRGVLTCVVSGVVVLCGGSVAQVAISNRAMRFICGSPIDRAGMQTCLDNRHAAALTSRPRPDPHLGRAACSAAGGGASRRRARTATRRSARSLSVLLFLAAIVSAFWYLRNEEFEREQEAVRRDTEVAQQQMRLRLIENHEQLTRMARELVSRTLDHDTFLGPGRGFTREHPEISNLIWLNDRRVRDRRLLGDDLPARDRHQRRRHAGVAAGRELRHARPRRRSSRAPRDAPDRVLAARSPTASATRSSRSQIPLIDRGVFDGALIVEYSVERLLRYFVPTEIARRHAISVLDARGRSLASTVMTLPGTTQARPSIVFELPVAPAENGLVLRGQGYRTSIGLIGNTPVLDGDAAVGAHRLDAARHLAPHAPAPADAGRARARRPTSGARWRTRCSPACAPWTWKAASATSTRRSAR